MMKEIGWKQLAVKFKIGVVCLASMVSWLLHGLLVMYPLKGRFSANSLYSSSLQLKHVCISNFVSCANDFGLMVHIVEITLPVVS